MITVKELVRQKVTELGADGLRCSQKGILICACGGASARDLMPLKQCPLPTCFITIGMVGNNPIMPSWEKAPCQTPLTN